MTKGMLLREAIRKTGIPVPQIAAELGMTKQAIYYKLSNDSEWTYRQAKKLQSICGFSEDFMEEVFAK